MNPQMLDYIISGGLVSMLIALLTLRSQVRKVKAQSDQLDLSNSEKATEILMHNIVEPLKVELHDTRHEIALLRTAIREASRCRYRADCPVIEQLQRNSTSCPHFSGAVPPSEPRSRDSPG